MKKILAVSLVAIMAVSTARADIASTAYVQGAVGAEKTLRESADTAIKNSIGTVSATNMGTSASTVVTAIKEHSDALKSVASSSTVSTLSGRVTAIENSDYAKSGVTSDTVSQVAANTAAIAGMDLNQVGADGDGKYIKTIKQENGKVTATAEAADTTPTQNSNKMVTSGGVYTALAGKQGNLSTTQMAAVNSGITSAKVGTYDAYNARITTAQNTADSKEASANKVSAIKDGMTTAEKQVAFPTVSLVEDMIDTNTGDLQQQVATNTAAITTLNGTGAGSVSKTVGDALKSYSTTAQMNEAITNNAVNTVVTGNTNGTIRVDGSDVAVKGLGSAAYTASTAYATSAQGAKADTAVQKVESGSSNGTIKVDNTEVSVTGLKSAAYTESSAYATSAQGAKADTAVQKSEVTTGNTNGTILVQDKEVAVKGLGSAAYKADTAFATSAQGTAATTAKSVTDAITSASQLTAGTEGGTYVLTMTKNATSGALEYKWELIDRTY